MYICTYVRMYVCMYVCMYIYIEGGILVFNDLVIPNLYIYIS